MSPVQPPEPAALAAARLGLLGGTFDPVHAGHLHVAAAARAAFDLDHVLFVPAARSPFKPGGGADDPRAGASADDRAAMVEAAVEGVEGLSVWRGEIERGGISYTIDTVRALAELAPASALFLLLGSDNLEGLPQWRAVEELLTRVRPVVVLRPGTGRESLARLEGTLPPALLERLGEGFLELEPVPVSSTQLRLEVARAGEAAEAPDGLPPKVWEYIARRGIYRGS